MRNIRFYTNLSEPNAVEKNATLLYETTFNSKHENNMLSPMFEMTITDVNTFNNILKYCNYCFIEQYGRSYFCTVEVVRTNVLRFTCNVDALNSWRRYIMGLACIIERNEQRYNLDINDGVLKTYQFDQISEYEFPNKNALNHAELVLAVAGGAGNE